MPRTAFPLVCKSMKGQFEGCRGICKWCIVVSLAKGGWVSKSDGTEHSDDDGGEQCSDL